MVTPMFPCPVCTQPREVRTTKKDKPYVICDPCGLQLFIRGPAGIEEFKRLIENCDGGVMERLEQMVERYRLHCPECGNPFWITPKLIKTSMLDGSLKGVRCPHKGCGTTVPWEEKQ